MKVLACAALLLAIALGASGCAGSGRPSSASTTTKTAQSGLHESFSHPVPKALRAFIHSLVTGPGNGPIHELEVYGPGSRTALVKASSGDVVVESAQELKMPFYLVVARGRFVCDSCSGPPGHKAPHGTIETWVWSAQEKSTDFGFSSGLPGTMSHLHRIAAVTLS